MSLPPALLSSCDSIQKCAKEMKSVLQALRSMSLPETAKAEVINGFAVMCGMTAEVMRMRGIIRAAQDTGIMEASDVKATDLELHPLYHNDVISTSVTSEPVQEIWNGSRIDSIPRPPLSIPELLRLEASLHRAGDHSQDLVGGGL